MLEEFSFKYIQQKLSDDLTVMERKELYKFLSKTKFTSLKTQMIDSPPKSSLDSNPYVSGALKEKVRRLPKKNSFKAQCNEIGVVINVYSTKETSEQIQHLVDCVTEIVSFLDHFAVNKEMNRLTISLYLLEDKKVVGKENILSADNVNGGSTSRGSDVSVEVWRKEEILKVTIHELIHAFSYDHPQEPLTLLQHYQHKYNVSSDKINAFEAYTEIWAEIIHCYYLASYILKYRKLDIKEYDLFRTFLQIEREFSLEQAQRVLNLHETDLTKDMNKITNVLAYYVIVGEIYENLQDFLEFCQKHNKYFINIQNLELYFRYLKELKEMVKKNTIGKMKTGRMTICQLKLF